MSRYKLNPSEQKEANRLRQFIKHSTGASELNKLRKKRNKVREVVNILLRSNTPNPEMEAQVGCTAAELKTHIENQFTEGMTWQNRGEWEIDHIRPLFTYDLDDPEQFNHASHYTNVRPLWGKTNNSRVKRHWHFTETGEVNDYIQTLRKEIESLKSDIDKLSRSNREYLELAVHWKLKLDEEKAK